MHEERMIAERKSRSFGLRLPTNIVDRMDEECERRESKNNRRSKRL